ncbi:hypothetical protein [Streptomyces niveus]|uniref:hypothetical protein n=1 Tax=Streptomyces niveus TaxID=193462 RepID=UPI003426E9E5
MLDQTSRARQYVRSDSEALNREDTANGRPGVPLQLRITLLDAERGAPVKGALIEVWNGCRRTGPDGAGSAFTRMFALGLREELKEHWGRHEEEQPQGRCTPRLPGPDERESRGGRR